MTENMTVTGLVDTTPRHLVTSEGVQIISFRLVSVQRRFDTDQQVWVDGDTNWFKVTAFRDWESGDRSGTTVEVEAETIGRDLRWGEAVFTRANRSVPLSEDPVG